MNKERLFAHFLDPIDGTLCLTADASVADIQKQAAPLKLRFPLQLDLYSSLSEQINAATHTPASHRFGPFCDNVIGMNWRLPTGRMLRIGERVVKTTTGYDWLRFLLHSRNRFGAPTDYVLRLRPDCGSDTLVFFRGDVVALSRTASTLLREGWMHWFDSVDFISSAKEVCLRVWIHTVPEERPLFEGYLAQVADRTHTKIDIERDALPPSDGVPDLAIKTTPDRAVLLATHLSGENVRTSALCYSGVVHAWLPQPKSDASKVEALVEPHLADILGVGGDWQSKHIPEQMPAKAEANWIQTLEEAIHGI